jgi:hypothetical protein
MTWYHQIEQWIMGTSQNFTISSPNSSHEASQLFPQLIPREQLTNQHRLDLQIGQHESVQVIAPLPENAQV